MEKRLCPICSRQNDSQDTHCWFCNAELPPFSPENDQPIDWLSELKNTDLNLEVSSSPFESNQDQNQPEKEAGEFTPDWLQKIRSREAAEREEKKANEERYWAEKRSKEGLPDWLRSLNEDANQLASSPEEIKPALESGNEPSIDLLKSDDAGNSAKTEDWLDSLKSWQQPAEEKIEVSTSQTEEPPIESIPEEAFEDSQKITLPNDDFDLNKIFSLSEDKADQEVQPTSANDAGKNEELIEDQPILPEGFNPLDQLFEYEKEAADAGIVPSEHDIDINEIEPQKPVDSSPFLENLDDILPFNEFDQALEPKEPEPKLEFEPDQNDDLKANSSSNTLPEDEPPVFKGEAKPFESGVDSAVNPFTLDEKITEPFTLDDLPEWLADIKPGEKPSIPVKPKVRRPVVDDGTPMPEKGKLPVWLDARRPVEAIDIPIAVEKPKPSEATSDGEEAGKSSMESEIVAPAITGTPAELGEGLKISNRQKTNAALLSVIATSVEPVEVSARTAVKIGNQSVWRSLLAIVFLMVAILGGTVLKEYYLQPELFPEEVVHTFNLVNTIPLDKPVLIAGDFDAGFAGEIRLTFQPVLEQMMRRGLNFALMAINPVDSALLESQIANGLTAVPSFDAKNKVVDLGYFPGGAIAIQNMGNSFSNAVRLTADLFDTSTHEITKNVHLLSDFGAIVVVTDKSENARVWIEQIQPELGDTPLLLITSAQASPLILPYYKSGQVAGLVSGLPGGMIYGRILGSNSSGFKSVASMQLILGLMASLVLIGGFVCLVLPKTRGSKRQ